MKPIVLTQRRFLAFVCSVTFLSGCAISRNEALPNVSIPANWSAPAATQTTPVEALWWTSFNDPVLNQLIADVLRTNNDLAAAAIRTYRAQLHSGLVDTSLTPTATLGANGNVSRTRNSQSVSRTSAVTGTLGYEIDLWGKLAAQREAARWEVEATVADREAAQLSLIGTAAAFYWQVGYLNQRIALGDVDIGYAEQVLTLVKSRYAVGAVSRLDVAQAEQSLSAQRAAQTQFIQQRTEFRNALAILFDRPPQRSAADPKALPDMPLPAVKAGLPAELLSRRPDLRAAEFRLRESLANIELTRTSFYPAFTLTGNLGTTSSSLEHLLQNPVAALGLGLALPFIQWNSMQLKIKVSKSQYAEAVVDFRQKLYGALSEVENALSARVQLDNEADLRNLSLAQAQRAEALAKARFKAGATDVQPWLDQQQRLRDAQNAVLLNRLNRLNNQMSLYKALGGGES